MAERAATRGGGRTLATLVGASLLPLNSTMIAVVLPDIARDFDTAPGITAQAIVTSYLVAAIALQPAGGKLGDRFGYWRMFTIGVALMATGALLGSLAPSLAVLACGRILMAVGGALIIPVTVALIRAEIPEARRGRAFGAFGAVMSLAAAIGPIIGGELAHLFGWRSVLAVNIPVIALAVALMVMSPRPVVAAAPVSGRPPVDATAAGGRPMSGGTPAVRRPAQQLNWLGMVLVTTVLVAFILTFQADGTVMAVLAGVSIALLLAFVSAERRAAEPIFDLGLFRSRSFVAGTSLVAVQNLVLYTLLFELPQVLQALFRLDQAAIGRLLIFMMASMVVMTLIAGRLTDTLGARLITTAGSLVCLAGVGLLAIIPAVPDQLLLPLVVTGAGLGLIAPAAQSALLRDVRREQSGTAAGMSSTMRYLGGIVGIAILSHVVNIDDSRADIIGEHRHMLTVFAVVLVAGLLCAVSLPGRDKRPIGVVGESGRSRDTSARETIPGETIPGRS